MCVRMNLLFRVAAFLLSQSCSKGSDIAEKRCFLFLSALSTSLLLFLIDLKMMISRYTIFGYGYVPLLACRCLSGYPFVFIGASPRLTFSNYVAPVSLSLSLSLSPSVIYSPSFSLSLYLSLFLSLALIQLMSTSDNDVVEWLVSYHVSSALLVITAFISVRTNLSPFTEGCRERDASM